MKKKSSLLIPLSILICIFQLSCSKMETLPEKPDFDWQPWLISYSDNKTLLLNKYWKLTRGTISPALNGMTDWFSPYDSCTKDDLYIFGALDAFSLHEGATSCEPQSPQIISGYWKYNSIPEFIEIKLPQSDTIKLFSIYTDGFMFSASSTETIGNANYRRTWLFQKQ